jgi:hypothetical protein
VTLLADVVDHLDRNGVRAALIGAEALSLHGIVRATVDIDLLTVSRTVLTREFWTALDDRSSIDVRRGDLEDPLAGVVRLRGGGGELLDLVVGKYEFQKAVVERAETGVFEGVSLPVVLLPDLVLLKLFAGGPKDAWDIQQILAAAQPSLIAEVEQRLPELPADARQLWERIRVQ